MPRFPRLARYSFAYLVALTIGLAILTSWATFTGYTAKQNKSSDSSHKEKTSAQLSGVGADSSVSRAKLNKAYGNLPLSFEANRGQTDANVNYIARGAGYNIFLTPAEAVLVFQGAGKNSKRTTVETESANGVSNPGEASQLSRFERLRERAANGETSKEDATVVRMRLEGANAHPRAVEGVEELPGKVNYLLGNDSSKWRTDIPTYSKVAYHNVYSGVDLVYYGSGQQLEYDLVVAPGADPSVIQIKFEGAESLRIDKQGNLFLKTAAGEMRQGKPSIFQEINGARKQIDGGYVLKQGNKVGFKMSRYDRRKPLLIDPILSYLSFVNGSGEGIALTVDPAGYVYTTGMVSDPNLNPTPGAYQIANGGLGDTFVTKINQAGNGVVYTTYLGGSGDDYGNGIAVDAAGNAYIAGFTSGNFPTTPGAFQSISQGGGDGYITKLNASGSALVFSTLLGGNDFEEVDGIAVDPNTGAVYVAGLSASTNLPVTAGAFRTSNAGGYDCYAAKLNANGTALIYLTYAGGGGFDYPIAMTSDSSGNVYLAGQTSSLDFPTQNAIQPALGGAARGFFKSTDAGASWGLSSTNLKTTYVYTIAINPTTPTTIYAGTDGGVYKTTNGGANWSPTGPIPTSAVRQLLIDPTATNTVYAGTASGVFKSTDGGNTWVARNNGLVTPDNSAEVRGLALHPSAPNTIYASGFGGIFKTTDGGANWTAINNGLPNVSNALTNGIVVDPSAPNTVYVTVAGFQRVYKTTDGGASWTAAGTGLPASTVNTLAINPASPATIYAGTNVGVYRTTNGGTNWSVINTGLLVPRSDATTTSNPVINAIAVDPVNPLNVYAAPNFSFATNGSWFSFATIFKSTDGGNNWNAQTSGFSNTNLSFASVAVDPTNPSIVYAGNFGDSDGFLLKLNSSGTGPVYSTYLGGSRGDAATAVAVDAANNVYVSGTTRGNGFPTTAGAFQTTLKGGNDFFVTKFDASGTSLAYSTYLGGTDTESANGAMAVDAAGNAYVAGGTFAADFPVTPGAFQTTIGNPGTRNTDVFVTKLNPTGTGLVYSSYLGGDGNDTLNNFLGNRLAIDSSNNAYVMGVTNSTNFPAFDYVNAFFSNSSTFVAKVVEAVPSYSITGRLTTGTSAPIAGVFVEASNGQGFFRGGVSDSQGFYSIISLPAGDYTVTPNRFDGSGRHYLYTPPTRTFVGLNSDQAANFTGTQVYDIQGQVTSSTVPGLGIFDVTVTLSGSASASAITDADGNYAFQDLVAGNYTVTPSKPSFTFNPANLTFTNLSADQFSANFTTASATFFTVSGRVADAGDTGIGNVLISTLVTPLRGFRTQSTQTDVNGNYSIPNLQAGGNYSFLPTKPLLSFTPQNPTFNNLSSNQTLNFLAAPVTGLIGKIAFARSDFSTGGISVMNADGTGELSITTSPTFDESPAWSPDGSKLAFTRTDAGTSSEDIFVMDADGSGVTRLTNAPLQDLFPSWSPDATKFTFTYGECSGTDFSVPEVFVMDSTGANRVKLTNSLVINGFSDWSPGGSTIAFARGASADCSTAEEQADLYAMDPDGSNQRILANNSDGESRPAYSPDGSQIAYFRGSASSNIGAALYVMNADGTGQTKISPDFDIGDSGKPTWSPDGTKIAFSGNLNGMFGPGQIFVINADGSGLAQITSGTVSRFDVSWQHYSISGRVTGNTTGLPITMALAGTLTRVTQTDANGNYVFGNLTPGGNFTVTPVSTAFGFNPAKTDINNLVGNQIANFAVLPQVIPAPTPPLADDFGGAQRDPAKWNLGTQTQPLGAFDAQIPVVQQNGQLVVTPRTQTEGLHYNGYVSVNSFDFNNATATVEVAQTVTNGADTIFAIGSDLDNFSRFVVRQGPGAPGVFQKSRNRPKDDVPQLIFQVRVGGQLTSLSIPYDPVQHRYMRFRHVPTTNSIAFETSPDNVTFTVRHEVVLQKGVSALTAELSAGTSSSTDPGQAVFDNFQLVTNTVQFSAPSFSVGEGQGSALLTVTRSGSTSTAAGVEYLSFDDSAHQSSKFILATGSLSFAAGETTKSFNVLIIDNSLVDGNQTLYLNLTDSSGAGLNSPGRTALTILDNDTTPPTSNPLDNPNAQFFVREHYYDFLNREPDPSGLAFWADQITSCGTDQGCLEVKRINVSAAFFLSIEFQETGYLVYRFYNAALNRTNNLPRYLEFIRDTQTIGRGVIVNAPGWEALLEANKVAYADKFAARPEFTALYPATLTPTQYVDALYAHSLIVPGAAERQAAIDEFNNPTGARGRALRRVVENRTLYAREFNRAFVLAQYFGYLRRNPNDSPDTDYGGYNFWLGKLNQFNGNFVDAEMVKAFIVSGEYRGRFGP